MTNAEIIQAIRNEIERLKGIGGIVPLDNREQKTGYESALIDIEIFLDSLEAKYKVRNPIFDEWLSKVNPKVREEVRENINRMLEDDSLIDEIKNFIKEYGYERGEDKLLIAIVARHFYELGCHRTAEKYDEIEYSRQRAEEEKPMQEGLEEEIAGMYQALFGTDVINRKERLYPDTFEAIARHFAEWGTEHLKK